MMGGVYAVESLEQALALRGQLAPHESVVTANGLWMGRDWLRVARPTDERAGVLARGQELKQLTQQLNTCVAELTELDQRLQDGKDALQALEEEREDLQRTLNQIAHQHTETRAALSSKTTRLEQLHQRIEKIQAELTEIQTVNDDHSQDIQMAREHLEQILIKTAEHEQQREQLSQRREDLHQSLQMQRQQSQANRDARRELVVRIETSRTQLSSLQANLERMQKQQLHLEQRMAELEAVLTNNKAPTEELEMELEQLLETRVGIEQELAVARQGVADCDHALRELTESRHFVEQKVQNKRGDLEQLRMSWQEVKVRRQTLVEQLEVADQRHDVILQDIPEEATVDTWQRQVEDLEQKIQRLGAINLAAIEEFSEETERKQYLDSQMADLNEALATLEEAIRKIDQETKERFRATFETVNERLGELFPRVFGGGMASLEMTSDDLLESGVTVMARPPGKRNSSIHLLSGGEKALTAVALVFAFFELNPAPFCILDEVDAPLDDSNAGRFSQLVKEMSERVQFIFITHNKVTMEVADQLIGVTMHEPGVSRTVTVDVDEAVQLAEAI